MIFLLACAEPEATTLPEQPVTEYACDPVEFSDTGAPELWLAPDVPEGRPVLVYGVNATDGWWMPRPFTPTGDGVEVTRGGLDIQRCVVYGL